jgi:hypothetical protein
VNRRLKTSPEKKALIQLPQKDSGQMEEVLTDHQRGFQTKLPLPVGWLAQGLAGPGLDALNPRKSFLLHR